MGEFLSAEENWSTTEWWKVNVITLSSNQKLKIEESHRFSGRYSRRVQKGLPSWRKQAKEWERSNGRRLYHSTGHTPGASSTYRRRKWLPLYLAPMCWYLTETLSMVKVGQYLACLLVWFTHLWTKSTADTLVTLRALPEFVSLTKWRRNLPVSVCLHSQIPQLWRALP